MGKILIKGKNGVELTGETLGIILALIIILGLAVLVVRISNLFSSQTEKNAENFIEGLAGKVNAFLQLEEIQASPSDGISLTVQGFKGDWAVIGWDIDDLISDGKPEKESCFGKGCLCICEKKGDKKPDCQERGYCKEINYDKISAMSEGAYSLSVPTKKINHAVSADCIFVVDKLMAIEITQDTNNGLILEHSYGADIPLDLQKNLRLCRNYKDEESEEIIPPNTGGF